MKYQRIRNVTFWKWHDFVGKKSKEFTFKLVIDKWIQQGHKVQYENPYYIFFNPGISNPSNKLSANKTPFKYNKILRNKSDEICAWIFTWNLEREMP